MAYYSVNSAMKNTVETTVRQICLTETDADGDLGLDYIRYSSTGKADVVLRRVSGNDRRCREFST